MGDYVRTRKATVTTFYLSNVEQYLFPGFSGGSSGSGWSQFYTSVGTLPLDSTSTFIRSIATQGRGSTSFTMPNTGTVSGPRLIRLPSVLAPMLATVTAFRAGQITRYQDVVNLSHAGMQ